MRCGPPPAREQERHRTVTLCQHAMAPDRHDGREVETLTGHTWGLFVATTGDFHMATDNVWWRWTLEFSNTTTSQQQDWNPPGRLAVLVLRLPTVGVSAEVCQIGSLEA